MRHSLRIRSPRGSENYKSQSGRALAAEAASARSTVCAAQVQIYKLHIIRFPVRKALLLAFNGCDINTNSLHIIIVPVIIIIIIIRRRRRQLEYLERWYSNQSYYYCYGYCYFYYYQYNYSTFLIKKFSFLQR